MIQLGVLKLLNFLLDVAKYWPIVAIFAIEDKNNKSCSPAVCLT